MRNHHLVSILLFCVGCPGGEKGTGDTGVEDTGFDVRACGLPAVDLYPLTTYPDYELKDKNWAWQTDPIRREAGFGSAFGLNPTSFERYGRYTTLPAADVITVFEGMLGAWNAVDMGATLREGTTSLSRDAADVTHLDTGFDLVMADSSDDDPADGYHTYATAITAAYTEPCMFTCDVVFYNKFDDGSEITWVTSNSPASNEVSLQLVMTHALGHCLGLADQSAASTAGVLMYSRDHRGEANTSASITAQDIAAVQYIYGPR